MAELFAERMQAAAVVAAYKEEHGLPVEDKAREAEMIARNTERLPPAYRPYYRNFLVGTITESKRYQRLLVSGLRVAYSGVEGAFAHVATMRIFGEPGEKVACPDFATAYRSVESGACHCAVLPIENSYAGDVGQVMDLAWRGSLTISGIYDLPLSQCLLAKPGVTLAEVREVVSHPQALAQCQPYLRRQGWIQTTAVNTAVAARICTVCRCWRTTSTSRNPTPRALRCFPRRRARSSRPTITSSCCSAVRTSPAHWAMPYPSSAGMTTTSSA